MTSRRLNNHTKIAIVGAGSIGCFIGGCLLSKGFDVTFIGRTRIQQELIQYGLNVTDWQGRDEYIESSHIAYSLSEAAISTADFILVTVKSTDTNDVAHQISQHVKPHTVIISFQNGIQNVPQLKTYLPNNNVLKAMVPFNVIALGKGQFHCGTEGHIAIEDPHNAAQPIIQALLNCQLPVDFYEELTGVQWSKLLMNLNNAINALSGIPLKEQLQDKQFRQVLSYAIKEGLDVLKASNIKPVTLGKVPLFLLPYILLLPNPVFSLLAASMLKIDPKARSSMYEDLALKRKTEVDFINGEIITLGKQLNIPTPVNSAIVREIHKVELSQSGSPQLSSANLKDMIKYT